MPAPHEFIFDLMQLRPHPLADSDTPQPEPPALVLPADMREAKKIKRLRFTQTPRLPPLGGVAPELDQPGLIRVQLQPELRKPLTKIGQEPPRITFMLEPNDKVVGECRPRDYADRAVLLLVGGVARRDWSA